MNLLPLMYRVHQWGEGSQQAATSRPNFPLLPLTAASFVGMGNLNSHIYCWPNNETNVTLHKWT